ncbi:MAG: 6-hydroxymethylpterin diphosphokinase MptE-like protein [Aminobacterium sp.]|uniref:motility associated factor glycosyltransferase family protein n=1 Tax=Aminobacterium sp. TaxID=1872491 RepID=UPI002B1F5A64|nr:6-hydroxymethylpterin diphosphokinase MptE-like protein [Aminobacterium sp.]MEA4878071.1 6-hydroxymethylpterin diphosphokinase MptE-like protein [Aminobacterium sp.]
MRLLTPNFDLWQKNLDALQKSNPQAAELLKSYAEAEKYGTFTMSFDDNVVELRKSDGRLHFREYRKKTFIEMDGGRKEDINLYIGFGLGYSFARTMSQERMNRAVIVETDPALLYWSMHIHEMEGLLASPGISWVVGTTSTDRETQWRQVFEKHRGLLNEAPCVFIHRTKDGEESVQEIRQIISEFRTALSGEMHSQLIDADRAYSEMAHNIVNGCLVHKKGMFPLSSLQKMWKEKPIIIASAGPSLDKQLPLLKKAQDYAVIIANDVIAEGLFKEGITPHVVVALDSSRSNYQRMKPIIENFREQASHTVFVAGSKVHPAVVSKWPGPISLTNCDALGPYLAKIMGMPDIRSGLCVSHLCYHLAETLHPCEIVFIGQDLSYGVDGKTHASSFGHYRYGRKNFAKVQSWDKSTTVDTNNHWYAFLIYFERCIADATIPVYNCTEGGAWIEGANHVPFASRVENWKEIGLTSVAYAEKQQQVMKGGLSSEGALYVMNEMLSLQKRCFEISERVCNVCNTGQQMSLKNLRMTSLSLLNEWKCLWREIPKLAIGLQSIIIFSTSGKYWNTPFPDGWKHKDFMLFWSQVYDDISVVFTYLGKLFYIWKELSESNENDRSSARNIWKEIVEGNDDWWNPWIETSLLEERPSKIARLLLDGYLAGLDKDLRLFTDWIASEYTGFFGEWCVAWKNFIDGELDGYIEMARLIFAVRHEAYNVPEKELDGAMKLVQLLPSLLRSFAVHIRKSRQGQQISSLFPSLLATLLDGEAYFWEGDISYNDSFISLLNSLPTDPFHDWFKKTAGGNWAAWTAERIMMNVSKEEQEKVEQKILLCWNISLKKAEKVVDI